MGGLGLQLGNRGGARGVQKFDDAPESNNAVSSGCSVSGATRGVVGLQGFPIGATLGLHVGFGLGKGVGLQL